MRLVIQCFTKPLWDKLRDGDHAYQIVEQTGPVTFKVWDHLMNKVKIVHVNDLKRATIEEWDIPMVTEKGTLKWMVILAGPSLDLKENDSEMDVELIFGGR